MKSNNPAPIPSRYRFLIKEPTNLKWTVALLLAIMLYPDCTIAQELPAQYREKFSQSFPIRKEQHLEIKAYADSLLEAQTAKSLSSFSPDFFSTEDYENSLYPYRKKVGEFYGYPPPSSNEGRISKFIKVGEDVNATVYRVWVEVMVGVHRLWHLYGTQEIERQSSTDHCTTRRGR